MHLVLRLVTLRQSHVSLQLHSPPRQGLSDLLDPCVTVCQDECEAGQHLHEYFKLARRHVQLRPVTPIARHACVLQPRDAHWPTLEFAAHSSPARSSVRLAAARPAVAHDHRPLYAARWPSGALSTTCEYLGKLVPTRVRFRAPPPQGRSREHDSGRSSSMWSHLIRRRLRRERWCARAPPVAKCWAESAVQERAGPESMLALLRAQRALLRVC